jgi:hypothetical protein
MEYAYQGQSICVRKLLRGLILRNNLLTCSQDAEAALRTAGLYETENFSSVGPAGIFALYANPAAPLGQVLLNEFVSVCGRTSYDRGRR